MIRKWINACNKNFPRLLVRLVFLITICVIFSIINPRFSSKSNLVMIITTQAPYYMLLATGMTIGVLMGGFDLSISSVMALTAFTCAKILNLTGSIFLAIVSAFAVAVVIELINGALVSKIKVPPFIATYGMDWVIKGCLYVIMGGYSIFGFPTAFTNLGRGKVFGISNIFWISSIVVAILIFIMHKTTFGIKLYSVSRNKEAARISGINDSKMIITCYLIIGVLATLTGILYISNLGAVDSNIGENWTLKLIAITFLGGTQNVGGIGSPLNTVIGTYIYLFIMNALILGGIPSVWQDFIIGLLVILSVMMELIRNIISDRDKRKALIKN